MNTEKDYDLIEVPLVEIAKAIDKGVKDLVEENKRLREYVNHVENCDICDEGIKYGMCEKIAELRRRTKGEG